MDPEAGSTSGRPEAVALDGAERDGEVRGAVEPEGGVAPEAVEGAVEGWDARAVSRAGASGVSLALGAEASGVDEVLGAEARPPVG